MSNIAAVPDTVAEASLQRLKLDALEEIEACGSRLLRQAGHLNRLLALVPGSDGVTRDHREVELILHELDSLLTEETAAAGAACLDRLRALLGLARSRTYAPMAGANQEATG